MRRGRQEPTEIILKSGKKVRRVIHHGEYWNYIIYNGFKKKVEWIAGAYYEVYQ